MRTSEQLVLTGFSHDLAAQQVSKAEIRLNGEAPVSLVPPGSNWSGSYTRGKDRPLDDVPPRPPEARIGWGLAVLAIVMIVIMIGWGWGNRNGGGWGRGSIARMVLPGGGSLHGPATRAWTPPSNGRFR
jgi:hypothetical protein